MRKQKILFLSPFPDKESIKEGMHQRIKAVDEIFKDYDRVYLDVDFKKYLVPKYTRIDAGLVNYRINFFLYFPVIMVLYLRSPLIFCHSIYTFSKICLLSFLWKKRIILDIHGVVTEEIQVNRKSRFDVFFYNFIEKSAFKTVSMAVHVTNRMKSQFQEKYPAFNGRHYVFANVPANLMQTNAAAEEISDPECRFGPDDVVMLYSGNMQQWQNIDLMLQIIRENTRNNVKYILLTGEPQILQAKLHDAGIAGNNIFVRSVDPGKLAYYYNLAHYGFILRDDLLINRVANPTKLIEYLYYGIVPVIKTLNIGDFGDYGCDYIMYNSVLTGLVPRKSNLNEAIAKEIIRVNNGTDFRNAVNNGPDKTYNL